MADIFNEIDEDLRRDQVHKLWDRYGVLLLIAAALIVVGVAGWRGYDYWRQTVAHADGDRFATALKLAGEGDDKGAADAFEKIAKDGSGGYPTLARLRAAGELATQGDKAAALAAFDAVGKDAGSVELIRGLARIRAGYLALDLEDRAGIEARMTPLSATGPWRHSAREILALATWKAGDLVAAKKWLADLMGDAEAPRDVTARAEILATVIRAATGPDDAAAPTAAKVP